MPQSPIVAPQPARHDPQDDQRLHLAALVAAIVACGVPLAQGLTTGWTPGRQLIYSLLALVFIVLTQIHLVPLHSARLLCERTGAYLTAMGMLGFLLHVVSGDPTVQPIVFTIPLVHAALAYGAGRSAAVGTIYLLLLVLSLLPRYITSSPQTVLFSVASYGALMVFMYSFTRMAVAQSEARARADHLAAELAQQRDYLQRLVEITATLTSDLDLEPVLEQVAAAGRSLARAGQARVWLRESEQAQTAAPPLRLAAAVPHTVAGDEDRAPELPDESATADGSRLVLPLVSRGAQIGLLELRERSAARFGREDIRLLRPFADAAAIAIENARLYEQAHLSATLAERNRLARELHDTIAQGLTATTMQLEAAQRSFERDPVRTRARLVRAHELARETLEDVRHSVWTLASPLVDGQTLHDALAEIVHRFGSRTGVEARYQHIGPVPQLEPVAAGHALRIMEEAIRNVEKHAGATSVLVMSETMPHELRLTVRDDGVGFEPAGLQTQPGAGNGFGIPSLHERARLMGGRLEIASVPGQGTCVSVFVPLEKS